MYHVKPYVTAHYPVLVRGMFKLHRKLYRDPVRTRILNSFLKKTAPSPPAESDMPFSVHSLICKRDLKMGICAAKALNLSCQKALPWIFHDDGSLSPEDVSLLSFHFPGTRIVMRAESDVMAEHTLAGVPLLRRWRKDHCYLLKIPDVKQYAPHKKVLFLDTDVLFFRTPEALLEELLPARPLRNAFNKDISTHYSLESEKLSQIIGKQVVEKVNVGLWMMNKEDLNLEKVEKWLSVFPEDLPPLKKRLGEQTLLAMLASDSSNGAVHLPETYDVAFEKMPETSVCKHYVGRIRHGFELEGLRYLTGQMAFISRWSKFVTNR